MMVRLPPDQISLQWMLIKQVATEVGIVPTANQEKGFNNLLTKLLSELWQCWVVYNIESDDTRTLHVIIITGIHEDSITGERYLDLHAVYAFRPFTEELRKDCLHGVQEFLRNKGCGGLIATTSNPKAEALLIDAGFMLTRKVYTLKM